ncbi:DUF86 domain-containing protein [uncultured Selenomonas sp.]|uniref:HepT-like ribonuclease domain-containing protein n=1 Tax=uncultured Selenomonas sp. TaxID=159275 RepID=UPI0025CC6F9A|nr:HepT-like ribonuclease domain-containing protein [uncultured Selenomonas sp.]
MTSNRDFQVLQHMYNYCRQILMTKERLKMTEASLQEDFLQQNAVSMPMLSIGELAKQALSESFRDAHTEIPWRALAGMRNRFAHDYGNMDFSVIWDTMEHDVPVLLEFCKEILMHEGVFEEYPLE